MTDPDPPGGPGVHIPPPPETRRLHWLHFRHRSMRRHLIRLGYWSSILFAVMVLIAPIIGDHFYPYRHWIGLVYLCIQFAEINAEDHLRNKDVLWDHLFSSSSALIGLVIMALILFAHKLISEDAWSTLIWFTACAWFDFIGGIVLNNTILNAPYQRDERDDDH